MATAIGASAFHDVVGEPSNGGFLRAGGGFKIANARPFVCPSGNEGHHHIHPVGSGKDLGHAHAKERLEIGKIIQVVGKMSAHHFVGKGKIEVATHDGSGEDRAFVVIECLHFLSLHVQQDDAELSGDDGYVTADSEGVGGERKVRIVFYLRKIDNSSVVEEQINVVVLIVNHQCLRRGGITDESNSFVGESGEAVNFSHGTVFGV